MVATDYRTFINTKRQENTMIGFEPLWLPDWLKDFQTHMTDWAIRKGRAAIFADCGLGKTPMQLVWAENVVRKTNRPVLVLTPLAVSHQTEREAAKFDIEATRCQNGKHSGGIVITNYERLEHFDPSDFAGVVCDESSIIKNYAGKRKAEITEFMRTLPYRLLCTATAAPNDFFELGTSSEALGYLGFQDMLSRFFKQETKKDYLGWGRTKYRFRGHAQEPFWRWVCSWARVCRKPSDLGYENNGFELPPLKEVEHVIKVEYLKPGMLFPMPAEGLQEQREERRQTLTERCEMAASLATEHTGPTVLWCHLNPEGDMLTKLIPGAEQVAGSMPDEQKEERLLAFQSGQLKTLVTKPKIGCFGLNWQHCNNVVTFPSHSWEQYYQAVRRCWRFGQKEPVTVHVVTTEGEHGVMKNLQRKASQADQMFGALTKYANDALKIESDIHFTEQTEVPSWL